MERRRDMWRKDRRGKRRRVWKKKGEGEDEEKGVTCIAFCAAVAYCIEVVRKSLKGHFVLGVSSIAV